MCLCVSFDSQEREAIFPLKNNNELTFVIEVRCVFLFVGTECLKCAG
jgi:hypothetical protein